MKHLDFVIWMLGWPLIEVANTFVCEYLLKKTYSDTVDLLYAIISIILYIIIARLLWDKGE
jgi:hypothetical protein